MDLIKAESISQNKLKRYCQFSDNPLGFCPMYYNQQLEITQITTNEIKKLGIELIGKCSVTLITDEINTYRYNSIETIPLGTIEDYLICKQQMGKDSYPAYIIPFLIEYLDNSGLVRVAVDENHFPPLKDKGYAYEVIQFAKLCLGAMYYESISDLSINSIYNLINANIEEFVSVDNNIYEKPRIQISVAEQVYALLNNL